MTRLYFIKLVIVELFRYGYLCTSRAKCTILGHEVKGKSKDETLQEDKHLMPMKYNDSENMEMVCQKGNAF